jgi:hypothetical protein
MFCLGASLLIIERTLFFYALFYLKQGYGTKTRDKKKKILPPVQREFYLNRILKKLYFCVICRILRKYTAAVNTMTELINRELGKASCFLSSLYPIV